MVLERQYVFHIGRLRVKWEWRSKHCFWGRFGGGWNWKVGIQAGGSSMIVELLVCSLRFDVEEKISGGTTR